MPNFYSISSLLQNRILIAVDEVKNHFGNYLFLEEYIVLPDFGQHVILRFEVQSSVDSLAEIDRIETRLKNIVGQEYWVTLVGSLYRQISPQLNLLELPERLEKLSRLLPNIEIPLASTIHSQQIQNDAEVIRANMKSDEEYSIWEIEVPWRKRELPIIRVITNVTEMFRALL